MPNVPAIVQVSETLGQYFHAAISGEMESAEAMAEAEEKNLLKEGDILNLVSFGAGFTWAGMVIRW